jgi:hypothetical protein
MKLTPFEGEVIDSILWQIKGFKEGIVTERATNRILRASIRRIKTTNIGFSLESEKETNNENDHAIPVKVIIKMILDSKNINKESILKVLSKYYVSVVITKKEHKITLKKHGLESEMPTNWNTIDPLARYKAAGIEIIENKLHTR